MSDGKTLTTTQAMEAVKAISELQALFRDSSDTLAEIVPLFVKAAQGEPALWFEGCVKIGELGHDDAHGCLIVAASIIAKIKAALLAGVPGDQVLRDNFKVDD